MAETKKKKMQKMTLFSAIITLLSFFYKITLAYFGYSLVLLIASISTLMVFICKALFVKNVFETREKKKKAYLLMTLAVLFYSTIFIAFSILKVNGIDISKEVPSFGLIGILFISLMFALFLLSIIGLKGALEKTDIMVIGLKEMTFISALADLVIIEEYVSIIILKYFDINYMATINGYFALGVCVLMLVVSVLMFFRYFKYKK